MARIIWRKNIRELNQPQFIESKCEDHAQMHAGLYGKCPARFQEAKMALPQMP
jgi:hypothetical protein